MRIRKNANLSSLIFSHASGTEPLQSHVCQLNQSPWDVIPFSQEQTSPSPLHQLEGEDSFNGNGSLGDSIGAVESNSFPSLMEDSGEEKVDKKAIDDNDNYKMEDEDEEDELEEQEMKIHSCKNKKKLGRPLKSYSNNLPTVTSKKSVASSGRRGRGKAARRGGAMTSNSAVNPYEFYYYSGFGPLWGKRRGGGRRGGKIMNNNNNKSAEIDGVSHDRTTSSSVDHFEELDFLDDEDSDDDNDNGSRELGGKKKRVRKPVKARSLKSLM